MTPSTKPSLLQMLRAVVPQRAASFHESLRVAELQASKLADYVDAPEGIQETDLIALPRVRLVHDAAIGVSGMSHWSGREWIITIRSTDSLARQRFTMLHEFKHIIDHGCAANLYVGSRDHSSAQQAEIAADYFAGCALVPKRRLKSAWGQRIQHPAALADHFGVSQRAIEVRLAQTGLSAAVDHEPTPRCARPVSTPRAHLQQFRPVQRAYRRATR